MGLFKPAEWRSNKNLSSSEKRQNRIKTDAEHE